MKLYTSMSAFVILGAVACDNDPVQDAHKTQATEAAPVAAEPAAGKSETYAISEANSTLKFVGAKITDKHDGSFEKFSGQLKLVEGDPLKSSVTVTIDMKEVETDTPKLTKHLKSDDFFDVEKFPEAKFQSTKIEKTAEGHQVTGNLTLHGVTKSISFPAKIQIKDGSVSVSTEFGIDRQDFEIVYPGMPDDLIKDEVLIKLDLKPERA